MEDCSPHSSRQHQHYRVVATLGCDDEAVATRWNIATQTKLEAVSMMVGLTVCKQRSESNEMPAVENIQHRTTLEYYLRDADTGGVGVTPLKILRPLGDAADILGSQSCHQKKGGVGWASRFNAESKKHGTF